MASVQQIEAMSPEEVDAELGRRIESCLAGKDGLGHGGVRSHEVEVLTYRLSEQDLRKRHDQLARIVNRGAPPGLALTERSLFGRLWEIDNDRERRERTDKALGRRSS
jgi:hypothetical protein